MSNELEELSIGQRVVAPISSRVRWTILALVILLSGVGRGVGRPQVATAFAFIAALLWFWIEADRPPLHAT